MLVAYVVWDHLHYSDYPSERFLMTGSGGLGSLWAFGSIAISSGITSFNTHTCARVCLCKLMHLSICIDVMASIAHGTGTSQKGVQEDGEPEPRAICASLS